MDATLTQKQRDAVEALEGARRAGVSLSDYGRRSALAGRKDSPMTPPDQSGEWGDRPLSTPKRSKRYPKSSH
jgi:hypothetical protein